MAVLASEGNWKAADTHFFGLCGWFSGCCRAKERDRKAQGHRRATAKVLALSGSRVPTHFSQPCRTKGICLTWEYKPCLGFRCTLVLEHKPGFNPYHWGMGIAGKN